MSFLQLDDGILQHPKFVRAVAKAGSAVPHLWLGLMAYCKRHLTDGAVPICALSKLDGPSPRWRKKALDALVEERLVELGDVELRVHDYLDWNLSRAEIERKAAERRARRGNVHPEGRHSADEISGELQGRIREVTAVRASSERRGERRVSVGVSVVRASSERTGERTGERRVVANDVADLDALGREPGRDPGRARARLDLDLDLDRDQDPPPSVPSSPAEPVAQSASTSEAPKRRVLKPRGRTKCSPDFQPDESTLAEAASLGFSEQQELKCRREFVNHWIGEGTLKADWQATYRNRLAKVAEWWHIKPPTPETPAARQWRERKAAAEKSPAQIAPRARERLNAVKGAVGELFARS